MKYIALLRGINVSGQKKILMKDLQKLYEDLSFTNVVTYIQSGNVIFDSKEKSKEKIKTKIEKAIEKMYGFDVIVFVCEPDFINKAIAKNPYVKRKDFDPKKMYVSILSGEPEKSKIQELEKVKSGDDEFTIIKDVIYLYLVGGAGKTKFSNTIIENKLKLDATTRNWNSINEIYQITLK